MKSEALMLAESNLEYASAVITALRAEVRAYDYMIETAYVERPVYNSLAKRLEDAEAERDHHKAWVAVITAEVEALRKDAARYRWLRDNQRGRALSVSALSWSGATDDADAAIDAAIAAEKP